MDEFVVRFDYEEFALKTIKSHADLMMLEKYIDDLACRIYTMQNEFEKYHVAGINRRDFAAGYNFSKLCDLAANLKAKIDSETAMNEINKMLSRNTIDSHAKFWCFS